MLLLFPLLTEGAMITTPWYQQNDAGTDIAVLESIMARHPEDLKTLRRLIDVTFTMEYFDKTEKYCERYLSLKKKSDVAYIKILAAASLGKFKTAADQIAPFIGEYKSELNSRDLFLLKYRENIYRKSDEVRAYPSGAVITSWGANSIVKGVVQREGLFAGYNYVMREHTIYKIKNDSSDTWEDVPVYISDLPLYRLNFVSLSDDGREVIVSLRNEDRSEILIRRFIPRKKLWSGWEKPENLNPGKWNHYPNFIDRDTVLFSSTESTDESDYDIYISRRDLNGKWMKAVKLPGINTPLDEISVWVHPDGETVYFCSNGYEGMGGFDIYGARLIKKGDSYESAGITNISAVNTFRNERYPLFVAPSGGRGYFNFSAGRTRDVYNCSDIVVKPVPVFFYTAVVTEDSTGLPVKGAAVLYRTPESGYSNSRDVYSDGFTGTVLRRNVNYTITVSAEGYEQFSKTIKFSGDTDLVSDNIKLKLNVKKTESINDQSVPDKKKTGIVTLVTAMKITGFEKSRGADVQKILLNSIGAKNGDFSSDRVVASSKVCGDLSCGNNEGKISGADFVVFGTIIKKEKSGMKTLGSTGEDQYIAAKVTGESYVIELNLLDISTGKILFTLKKSIKNPDLLKNSAGEFAEKTSRFYKEKNQN